MEVTKPPLAQPTVVPKSPDKSIPPTKRIGLILSLKFLPLIHWRVSCMLMLQDKRVKYTLQIVPPTQTRRRICAMQ